ncbi:Adenylate kinase 9 [Hypsibius exemplaris]|uniref:Adenylate kinase 9 n=1 Tax=Hypsibius exemplaris TaxID=2072580 RepID=A0A1W0WV29_HYPEX|nr:Adenylate kinase 9 [Hypsibius exemplaris]
MVDGFVINMRSYMNEVATPKLQKPPVESFPIDQPMPYWRRPKIPLPNAENLSFVEKALPAGLVPVKLPFLPLDSANPLPQTPEEHACADSLTGDSALSSDVLTTFFNKWTKEAPFIGRNLVFDGFPMYPDDARFLLEKGIIPDAVFLLNLDPEVALERALPKRKKHWTQEKGKKDEKRFRTYSNKKREWEKQTAARKADLLVERAEAKNQKDAELAARNEEAKARGDAEEAAEEEDEEELADHLEQQLADEIPEPKLEDEQGEEESEDEISAEERLKDELNDRLDKDTTNIDNIRESFEEKKIQVYEISVSRSELLAQKKWKRILEPLLRKREHIFEAAFPVSGLMAKEMLDCSFKRVGKFGTWCPVKIRKGHLFPPASMKVPDLFPVVYKQYLYLCSTQEARVEFLARPEYFVRQLPPRLCIPVRLAVIGPPKSGKTTFANRLAEEIGIRRISIGDAIRYVQSSLKKSELCRILTVYLTSGTDVPDTLEILCLEALLRTTDCQARGWILDGYPTTITKLNTMIQRFIVPTIVFELVASNKVCVFRSVIESMTTKKMRVPLFNNSQVVATRLAHYKINIPQIKSFLQSHTRNLVEIDASASKWKMWDTALEVVANRTVLVQDYVERREKRLAAPLTGLCVTPHQMSSRLSDEYRYYCPITYNVDFILFDCILKQTYEFIAEFKEKYYLFASREKLNWFLQDPERWLPPGPEKIRTIPQRELLPRVVRLEELEEKWGEQLGFGGMCPVTYYEHDCLQPHKFSSLVEPKKRPPQPEHPSQLNPTIPAIPFLESKVGPLLVQAILEVSELRPKYPQIGYKESSLLFVANYLKFANLNSPADSRNLSREKLKRFADISELAAQLMVNARGIPNFAAPGQQHTLFERTEELKQVKKELQDDWHKLCPF